MFQRLFGTALVAGLLVGLLTAGLQQFTTTPLIKAAEVFEVAEAGPAVTAGAVSAGHEHHLDDWKPAEGLQRFLYTSGATVLISVGFSLVLVALMALKGDRVSARTGLLWGAAGFAAISLAPAIGLPPEVPGMPTADLGARQLWWIATALSTGAGLWMIAFSRSRIGIAIAVALIAIPHIFGAPIVPPTESNVPAELAARFTTVSLGLAVAFWSMLGAASGYLFNRWR